MTQNRIDWLKARRSGIGGSVLNATDGVHIDAFAPQDQLDAFVEALSAHAPAAARIDRIDVDDFGHAVVIDYKGSLSDDYDLYDAQGQERGGKVQALIYAQAVRRLLGLDVVGAIYVSYGRITKVSGAIDARLEPLHLPGIKAKACVFAQGSLSDLIDATEARVAEALDGLLAGDIAPHPARKESCTWCPEVSCPQRRG